MFAIVNSEDYVNAAICSISPGSELFAKVSVYGF